MYLKGDVSVSWRVLCFKNMKHILKKKFCPLFLHFQTEVLSDVYSHIFRDPSIDICSQHKLSQHLRLMKAPGAHSDLSCLTTCLITWQM